MSDTKHKGLLANIFTLAVDEVASTIVANDNDMAKPRIEVTVVDLPKKAGTEEQDLYYDADTLTRARIERQKKLIRI